MFFIFVLKLQEANRERPKHPHVWLWGRLQWSPSSGSSPPVDHQSSVFSPAVFSFSPAALVDPPVLSRRVFRPCHWGQGGRSCAGSSHPEPPISTGPSHPATGVFDEERRAGLERSGAESGELNERGERSEEDAEWISTGVCRKSNT